MRKTLLYGLVGVAFAVLIVAFMAQTLGLIPTLTKKQSLATIDQINTGASTVNFTSWELQTWLSIKNRLTVNNSDPAFIGNRTLQWISMRNSSSGDYYYYQKSNGVSVFLVWTGR
jgi:hypothetical protein